MSMHDKDYEPSKHPLKELFYWLISPLGWIVLVFILVLL